MLLDRDSHSIFNVLEPVLNLSAHFDLPVEEEKLTVLGDHSHDVLLLQLHEFVLLLLFLKASFWIGQGPLSVIVLLIFTFF